MSLDQQVFMWIQGLTGNSLLDQAMLIFAEYLVILVPLSLIYLWFTDRETSAYTFYTTVLGIVISYAMGMMYFHKNPSATLETIVASNSLENAFPSQHTSTVFATALPVLYREKKKIGGLLLTSAFLTGFARIYIGEHWPVDILGATVAAGLALIISELTWEHLEPVWKPALELSETVEQRLKAFIK